MEPGNVFTYWRAGIAESSVDRRACFSFANPRGIVADSSSELGTKPTITASATWSTSEQLQVSKFGARDGCRC